MDSNLEKVLQWQGTASELADEIKKLIQLFGLPEGPERLASKIGIWRSKKLFSHPKKEKYGFRQILEGLAIVILISKGWMLAEIGEVLPLFSSEELEQQILAEANGQESRWLQALQTTPLSLSKRSASALAVAEDAIVLLAQGIIRQYTKVLNQEIVRQEDSMPPELYRAMCKLGRLYIEEEKPDRAACVHTVLERARHPIENSEWGLDVLKREDFRFGQVRLIESVLRVPTADCAEIANVSGAFGEDNVIERRLYERLIEATEKLGPRRKHKAYTAVRELLGRRSLIGERQLLEYLNENNLTPLQGIINETFFDSVPDIWLIDSLAYRCGSCGTLMRRNATGKIQCPLRQCEYHSPSKAKVYQRIDPNDDRLLIAKPQILTYWTGPGIDELKIFDAAKELGLDAKLYPESDLCDIAINGRKIGIDVKSYTAPISLALKLNRSIGGLSNYSRRIVAVSDLLIKDNPDYLSILRSNLDKKGDPTTVEIMSVEKVIKLLNSL